MESQVPFGVYSIKTHNAPLIKEAAPVFQLYIAILTTDCTYHAIFHTAIWF